MECNFCGEQMSPESTTCPSCGHSRGDPFFFAEDKNGRTRRPVMAKPPGRKEPSALKPGRHVNLKAVLSMTGAGVFVIGMIVVAVLMSSRAARISWDSPEKVVKGYYDALSHGDLDAMLSLVSSGYQPTPGKREALKKAMADNTYKVDGLGVRILSNDRKEARVAIESLDVTVTPGPGGQKVTHSLTGEIVQPARQANPDIVMLVKLESVGGEWKLLSRPYNGWAPENTWALGAPSPPFADF